MRILALLLVLGLAGCGDDDALEPDAGEDAAEDGAEEDSSEPVGDAGGDADELAEKGEMLFFRALRGEVDKRDDAIEALGSALEANPDHPRASLLYGMALLSALTEDGNMDVVFDIGPALAHAADLNPDDERIPGWLQIVEVRTAQALGNPVLLEQATEAMIEAADAYPEFNNVSLAIAFAKLPLDSEYPEMAADRLDAIMDCTDAVCMNSDFVPHNEEGAMMLYGDVYARLGQRAKAATFYQAALDHPAASTWPYREQAQAIFDALDDRIELFTNDVPEDDPLFFSEGETSCVGCHAD